MLNVRDVFQPELPEQGNYEQALRTGLEIFSRRDPGRIAQKAGARLDGRTLVLPHLDKEIVLNVDTHCMTVGEAGGQVPIWLGILAVHYLNNADGRVPTGKLKNFREFRDGLFFEPAFNRATKDVLAQVFGSDPAAMVRCGEQLGGKALDMADAAVELKFFPFLPLTCVLWKGDEEFPAEAGVLFDETADVFFSAEDMAVAGQMAVVALLKAAES